jgi:ribosomal protein S18 acetylase RimI-like enzyme
VAASLRSYEPRDADAVVELSRAALSRPELHVGNPIWTVRDELETEIADWEPPATETLCVAESDGQVLGFGGVEHPRGFTHAELFGPLVAVDARGQRLGTQLLERSLEIARGLGAESVIASVGKQNSRGRMILEAEGFHPRGRPQATFRLSPGQHRPLGGPPEGTEVRLATRDDLPAALELYRECFPEGRFPEAVWRENLEVGTVYAAVHEGELVAVLNIDPTDRWIYHVGVTASERNRGVGSFLLSRSLEDYWERHPGETLGLDVDRDNVPAIKLYRRQGFAPWLVLQSFELGL